MTTTEKVQAILKAADLSTINGNMLAKMLCMSPTKMRGLLRAESTTYAELLKDERIGRCRELFSANPHADGSAVMRKCGYRNIKAAYRAFKRFFGVGVYDVHHRGARIQSQESRQCRKFLLLGQRG